MKRTTVLFGLAFSVFSSACAVGSEAPAEETASNAAPLAACPRDWTQYEMGTRESTKSNEASGLAASRKNQGVLWTHDDSGDSARVFAMTYNGDHLGIYNLAGAGFVDWEDMGIGVVDGAWHLFLADIGGNVPRRDVQVYVVPEPNVSETQAPVTKTVSGTRRLNLHYPDRAHNAESIFVDPRDGALYVITKSTDGLSKVFKKKAPHLHGSVTTLVQVAQLDFARAPLFTGDQDTRRAATGADISPDGSEIVVKTKYSTFLWRRSATQTIAQAFATTPCPIPNGVGEAIAFAPSGNHLFTTDQDTHSEVFLFYREGN